MKHETTEISPEDASLKHGHFLNRLSHVSVGHVGRLISGQPMEIGTKLNLIGVECHKVV